MIMESQNCVFLFKEDNTVKLYPKGFDTFNQASEKRGGSIEVREGDRAHKESRKHAQRTIL